MPTLPAIYSYQLIENADDTDDTRYPAGDKQSPTPLSINLAAYNANPPNATNILINAAVSYNLRQYLQGTNAATAVLSVLTVSGEDAGQGGWGISTDGNSLTNADSAVGAGTLQVQALDPSSGNTVLFPQLPWSIIQQQTGGGSAKFHGGFYSWPGAAGWNSRGDDLSALVSLAQGQTAGSGWTGIKTSMYPAFMVADTAGNYTAGFKAVDNLLAQCALVNNPQRVMLSGETLSYFDAANTSLYPQYMISAGIVENDPGGTAKSSVAWWTTAGMNALIKIWSDWGARYDSNPLVEMISPLEESTNPGSGFSWSAAGVLTQLQNMVKALSPKWPNTLIRLLINFTGSTDAQLAALYDFCKGYPNVCIGGPDPEVPYAGQNSYPLSYPTNYPALVRTVQADYVFRGQLNLSSNGSSFGITNGEDFRPNIIWVGENQALGLLASPYASNSPLVNSPAEVCQYQVTLNKARYMIFDVGTGSQPLTNNINAFVAHPTVSLVSTGTPTWPPSGVVTGSYDYYIGPGGSDGNPGTQSSPWAITAINSKRSTYAGKKVGLLPGTYNVYSLCQAGSYNAPALAVLGGASSPTLIQSTVPRAAILTAANPSGGGYPSVECGIIGQGASSGLSKTGNVIIDGLYVTRSWQHGISFYLGDNVEGGVTGIEIRNCEIYDISGLVVDNVGGVMFHGVTGAWVHNNEIHNIQASGVNDDNVACIYSYYSRSNIYEYNTLYDANNALFDKYYPNGNHTFRYNYVECAALYPQNGLHGCSGGQVSGDVTRIYNNVLKCPSANLWDGSLSNTLSQQGVLFYNNTCQFGANSTGIAYPMKTGFTFQNYNNVFIPPANLSYQGVLCVPSGTLSLSNFNNWGGINAGGSNPFVITLSSQSSPGVPAQTYTFAQAQGAGFDKNSCNVPAQFKNAGLLNPAGYQLVPGSPGSASGPFPGSLNGLATGTVPIFTQPTNEAGIAGNMFVTAATTAPKGAPPKGQFEMVQWEINPYTPGDGHLVANSNSLSSKTGFAPASPSTAQLCLQSSANSSGAQMEGGTVGAYMNSVEMGATLDGKFSLFAMDYFVTPAAPFAQANSIFAQSINLQIPTATVSNGGLAYWLMDALFVGPGGVGISLGTRIFPGPGQTNVGSHLSQDPGTGNFEVNCPLGGTGTGAGKYMTPLPGSNLSTGSTWNGFRPFSWQTTQAQFAQALTDLAAMFPSAGISTDPTKYTLSQIHTNSELAYTGNGNDSGGIATLGWSMDSWSAWSSAGGTIDMGAWGGIDQNTGQPISQIGANFTAGH